MIDEEQFMTVVKAVMSDRRPVMITMPMVHLWLVISSVQLATRHPGISTYMRSELVKAVRVLQRPITQVHPQTEQLLAMGWNSQHDQPSDVKLVCNCWTIYTAPGQEPLASIGRPQDWGDPRWLYKVYTLEATINSVRYRNEVHCWHEGQIKEGQHLEIFVPLVAMILLPGHERWKSGRDYLAEDDFWRGEWGKMPPHYDEDSTEEGEEEYHD